MSALPALTLAEITRRGLDPAFKLLPAKMDTLDARAIELTIALQESQLRDRRQLIKVRRAGQMVTVAEGPAKSFWQAEVGGGLVSGVLRHPATKEYAQAVYQARHVKPNPTAIWNAIENDDVLAAALARLLIFTDPQPLPRLGDSRGAWALYAERLWKPGKPKPETWPGYYREALEFVTGTKAAGITDL